MTDARCEPPEGLREKSSPHILLAPSGDEVASQWSPTIARGYWGWPVHGTASAAYADGWRYLCPVATPAEVAALRTENARLREALEAIASPDALLDANPGAFAGYAARRMQEQARAALTPTEAPDERT